jgi:hypothetical protein
MSNAKQVYLTLADWLPKAAELIGASFGNPMSAYK